MPTLNKQLDPKKFLSEAEYVILRLVFQEINTLRTALSLAPRTEQQLKNAVRQILSDLRRT